MLNLSRSGIYYKPVPIRDKDIEFMRMIDEIHLEEPYLGSRGMKNILNLSKPHTEHKIYPYLLRNLNVSKANEVWWSDITYIPMARGFCYLVAIMDWASRKVLSCRLSNTLDVSLHIQNRPGQPVHLH